MRSPGARAVSTFGVAPGNRCRAAKGIVLTPEEPATVTFASSAIRLWAKSPGYVAMQSELPPRIACCRFKPSIAAQPEPGSRLLHAVQDVSRKYGHRVRCSTLPPSVAMLRSCALAASRKLWEMMG